MSQVFITRGEPGPPTPKGPLLLPPGRYIGLRSTASSCLWSLLLCEMEGGGVLFGCHGNSNPSTESLGAKLNRGRGSWPCVTTTVATFWQLGAEKDSRSYHTFEGARCAHSTRELPLRAAEARGTPALSPFRLAGIPSKHQDGYAGSIHWEPRHGEGKDGTGKPVPGPLHG